MSEKTTRSLLDFAISASAAVLPVMLGVLLLPGVIRPDEKARLAGFHNEKDRYVSVRHLAALKTFERSVAVRTRGFAPSPSAQEVASGLPQCRDAWNAQDMAAQLAAFDAALLRFSSRPNGRVSQPVGLDGARWLNIARDSLVHAVETPQYPGRVFTLNCDDLTGALHALSRADARMLDALEWRGTVTPATLARWRPEQQVEINAHHVMRRNPWNGIAGCIYLGHTGRNGRDAEPSHFIAAGGSLHSRLCAMPAMSGAARAPAPLPGEPGLADAVDDPRWAVPPSLYKLLEPLEALRQPSRPLYRFYTEAESPGSSAASGYRFGPNRIVLDGAAVDVGFSVRLTIDPGLQSLAQKMAACYTGRQDVCRALGVQRAEDQGKPIGHRLLEQAMVRMAAVAVIDIGSGRIEALAGSMSPCARQEVDGPGRDPRCDKRLPYPVRFRPDALLNPAVFHDAMPASTIKPIMAAAFLSDPDVGTRWMSMERAALKHEGMPARDSLRGQLMRSDSAR
ncbi:MAG TPA: hypothetical protein VFP68_12990, partial [Burkholderiaceae bacterium]|nr:hypothetical protein [Burkholderiaceae bacterium]